MEFLLACIAHLANQVYGPATQEPALLAWMRGSNLSRRRLQWQLALVIRKGAVVAAASNRR